MNIEHIGIYSQDPAALAAWYSRVLGLHEVRRIEREGRPPVVFLQGATGVVVEVLPAVSPGAPRRLDAPGYSHLGIVVDDIEGTRDRLADEGIELTGVRATSNGWTIGYLTDPEGNIIELVER